MPVSPTGHGAHKVRPQGGSAHDEEGCPAPAASLLGAYLPLFTASGGGSQDLVPRLRGEGAAGFPHTTIQTAPGPLPPPPKLLGSLLREGGVKGGQGAHVLEGPARRRPRLRDRLRDLSVAPPSV